MNLGDITEINESSIGEFDILVGGSPCTNISIAGNKKGIIGEESKLFYDFSRILNHCKPKYFVFENVDNLLNINGGNDWEIVKVEFEKNYNITYERLAADKFGSPQPRKRLIVVGIRHDIDKKVVIPLSNNKTSTVKDILEDLQCEFADSSVRQEKIGEQIFYNPENKYYTNVADRKYLGYIGNAPKQATKVYSIDGKSVTICANGGGQGGKTGLYLTPYGVRNLNETECFRMSGFRDEDVEILKDNGIKRTPIIKMAGNTIYVPMLEEVFKALLF